MKAVLRLFFGLLSLGFLAACSSSDNLAKPSPLVKFEPSIHVEKIWSHNTGGSGKQYLNLQIGHDASHIYTVSYKGVVLAFNANTGEQLWKTTLDTKISSGISAGQHLLVVGTVNGDIIALNANNGSVLWKKSVGNEVLGKAGIADGIVVVKTITDNVIALQASDGHPLWHFAGDAPSLILRGGSQPKIMGNKLLVGFANGKVGLFNLKHGTPIWQQTIAEPEGAFPIQRMVDVTASPIINNGMVYVVTYQGNIAVLELNTGQIIWQHKLSSYTGLALRDGYLFATDATGYVWCFEQEDGGVVWRQKKLKARVLSAPALLGNNVIVGDAQGYIHWLAQDTGKFLARKQLSSDPIRATPIVIGNILYVLDIDGHLAAYRIQK